MKHALTVRWLSKDARAIGRIRERFGIPRYTTLNGLSPAEVEEDDMPLLRECEKRGFLHITSMKWQKNKGQFVFKS